MDLSKFLREFIKIDTWISLRFQSFMIRLMMCIYHHDIDDIPPGMVKRRTSLALLGLILMMLMVLLMMLMVLLMMMMLTIFLIRRASRAQRGSPAGRTPQFNHPSVSTYKVVKCQLKNSIPSVNY